MERPPLDEWLSLFRATIAAEGITTGAGAPAGNTFVDAALAGAGANSFVSMLAILYPGDPRNVDSKDIIGFTDISGTVTLAGAYKGVAAAIPAGVPYKIVTFRLVPAEVAELLADVGDASTSALGSLYAILGDPPIAIEHSIGHIPKYTGNIWFVDGTSGNDANTGTDPHDAFATIAHAIGAAAAGDRIYVMAGAYDEVLNMNLVGLELVCEQGTILTNTTPGTALIISADYCRVVGAILAQAGQTGLQITGNFASIEDCLAFGCATGFDDNGAETHLKNCRSILHTTTGFDISAGYGQYERCIAASTGAVRGVHLSNAAADHNHFFDCHTLGNATAGWEVIVGADNNMASHCSTGAGDGAKVDAGANNTWDDFSEGSQIVAGQTRDQDLKDIHDDLGGVVTDADPKVMGRLQIAATTIDLNQVEATYDLFTGTTQDVVVEKLVIRMPAEAAGGALTSISIQTDDATPQVIISAADGAVANLTSEAQLAWTGAILIDAGTGAKIQLTIAGGAHGSSYVCDVIAECRAVVSGGYLA